MMKKLRSRKKIELVVFQLGVLCRTPYSNEVVPEYAFPAYILVKLWISGKKLLLR